MRPLRGLLLCVLTALGTAACSGDRSGVTDPNQPPPADTAIPSFVRLTSDAGDYIGGGQSYEYTHANSSLTVTASGGHLSVEIDGNEWWYGAFESPSGMTRLQAGTYTGLQRYPFQDPAVGGLDWSGEGRGCNTLSGWFAIDSVRYDADSNLAAVDLHFEQHCEGVTPALRGTVHWRADDATQPPGPVTPIPSTLWRPSAGSLPSSGNFVYLASDAGDYIGGGQTYTYTPANATIEVSADGGHLQISVGGWYGNFQTMNTITRLQAGYYPDLHRYPFHNPATGGLDWSGNGRGCNELVGWFAVDAVTYSNGSLTALDLRFEQHCEGVTPALRGAIHWRAP